MSLCSDWGSCRLDAFSALHQPVLSIDETETPLNSDDGHTDDSVASRSGLGRVGAVPILTTGGRTVSPDEKHYTPKLAGFQTVQTAHTEIAILHFVGKGLQ